MFDVTVYLYIAGYHLLNPRDTQYGYKVTCQFLIIPTETIICEYGPKNKETWAFLMTFRISTSTYRLLRRDAGLPQQIHLTSVLYSFISCIGAAPQARCAHGHILKHDSILVTHLEIRVSFLKVWKIWLPHYSHGWRDVLRLGLLELMSLKYRYEKCHELCVCCWSRCRGLYMYW